MKKLIFTFVALLTMVCGANAKTVETTLWNGTYTDGVELNSETVATFKAGDVLRVYVTVPEEGANFKIVYKGASNDWKETTIPSLVDNGNQNPWVNGGDTYKDITFTDADITALSGMNIYIYKGENSTITKVSLRQTPTPTSTTNISSDSYAADWDGKAYDAVDAAQIGDVIRFTYTATGTWLQMYVMNNSMGEEWQTDAYSITNGESYTYEYVIPDYATLKKIRTEGFAIKGQDYQISSVDLLTYADSYGYTTVTITDTGYATWSSDKKYDFATAGITAYYASAVETGTVTLTSMDITWDYQGYILKATPGDYDVMESLTTDGTYYPSTNYLKYQVSEGTVNASESGDTKYRYIFAKHNSEIGFYKLTTDHTLAAHKAYLETPDDITPTNARVALIFENSEPTAIKNVNEWNTEDFIYYNLNGVRVQNPTKGLYIVNGKKVVVR